MSCLFRRNINIEKFERNSMKVEAMKDENTMTMYLCEMKCMQKYADINVKDAENDN